MSTPSAPQIRIRPRVTDQTLEFFWQAPVTDGGSAITGYTIYDGGANSNDIAGSSTYFKITGLSNSIDYTFSVYASNTNGAGEVATFRTVQTGLKPYSPAFVSFFRESDTKAKVTWYNSNVAAADPNYPNPWRNVIVAPEVINGKYTYPGDNSVTANAARFFGEASNGSITLTSDISHNFFVRAMNDPGYSLPEGSGTLSLLNNAYSGEVILQNLYTSGNYQNVANYIIKKQSLGTAVLNVDRLSSLYGSGYTVGQHKNGFVIGSQTSSGFWNYTFISKNGFVQNTLSNDFYSPYIYTRTNPIVPIVSSQKNGGPYSMLPITVYNYSNNTFTDETITIADTTLSTTNYQNFMDSNCFFSLLDYGTSRSFNYTITSPSTTPVLQNVSLNGANILYSNYIDKELFVITRDVANTQYTNILYIPNTGSPVNYDISGTTNITLYNQCGARSKGKLVLDGNEGGSRKLFTFTLTGTPSVSSRVIDGTGGIINITPSNTFSNSYQGYSNLRTSFVDVSGDSISYAISPVTAVPALAFNGSAQTAAGYSANNNFTGTIYQNQINDFYFTGIGASDGNANTKSLKYGAGGTQINSGTFTFRNVQNFPEYSLVSFSDGSVVINPLVRIKYNTGLAQFDVSGADVSGYVVNRSDNSGANIIGVTGGLVNRSYMLSATLWPPTELPAWFEPVLSTYPSSQYTIGIKYTTNIFYIYNNDTFDISGTIAGIPNAGGALSNNKARGPDCWYFWEYNGSTILNIARVSTSGVVVSQSFSLGNFVNLQTPKVTPSGFIMRFDDGQIYYFIDFDVTRNTFVLTPWNYLKKSSPATMYTTYLPNM